MKKHWHYLSFADEQTGFKGAVIVEALNTFDAVMKTHRMNINPGGEVIVLKISAYGVSIPAEPYRNKLLSRQDIVEFWPDAKSIAEHEENERNSQ